MRRRKIKRGISSFSHGKGSGGGEVELSM